MGIKHRYHLGALVLFAGWICGQPASGAIDPSVDDGPATVYAARFGYDPVDATKAFQAAIDSGARKVVVENLGTPWIVNPIQLASDQEIVFEKGVVVEAKRGGFKGTHDCLLAAVGKKDIRLIGYGATFRMWKRDYQGSDYAKGEWRHALSIRSCTNVRIYGLTLADSGGDGINLGVERNNSTNTDLLIKDVTCIGNNRLGISVVSAEYLVIENCVLQGTEGTAPEAGIDFEPNYDWDRLVNVLVRGCVAKGNHALGYALYLPKLQARSRPVSIRFENCQAFDGIYGVILRTGNSRNSAVQGGIAFTNCTFQNSEHSGVFIEKPAIGCALKFDRCVIANAALKYPREAPIGVMTRKGSTEAVGGVEFLACTVDDRLARAPLFYNVQVDLGPPVHITGDLEVVRASRRIKCALNDRLIYAWAFRQPWEDEISQ